MIKRSDKLNDEIAEYAIKHGNKEAALKFGISLFTVKEIRRRFNAREKKRISSLSFTEMEAVRVKAMMIARQKGYGEYAEDFASFAVLKRVEGYRVGTSHLDHDFVDFMRETFGRSIQRGKESAFAKSKLMGNMYYEELSHDVEQKQDFDWDEVIEGLKLSEKERAIFIIHFRFGFNLKLCGYVFGVTESRSCQIVAEVIKKIKRDHSV